MTPKRFRNRVAITGVGPVTSVGVGAKACWDAIERGRSQTQIRRLAVDIGKHVELHVASLADSPPEGMDRVSAYLDAQHCADNRDLAYAILAAELAALDANLTWDRQNNRVGMIQAFEAPGVETTVARLFGLFQQPMPTDRPPPVYDLLAEKFYNMQAFNYVHVAAKALGLHGFCTSVHNACSSGAFAIEVAANCIRQGRAEVMIVVGGEAFDTAVRLEWFRRLDLYCCQDSILPFALQPSGFFVGEGAAALVLESEEHAAARGANSYAYYSGGSFAHQGWKQTLPDVSSARLAGVIQDVLKAAETSWNEIDLVIPHGAATTLSDRYETDCLERALRTTETGTPAETTAHAAVFKPNFGHLLGASGLLETLAGLLCMKHRCVPPCLGGGDRRFPFPFAAHATPKALRQLLKVTTGFTGHDAASLFHT